MMAFALGLGFGYFALPIAGLGVLGHLPLRADLQLEIALYRGLYDAKDLLEDGTDDSVELQRFQVAGALDTIGLRYFFGEHFFAGVAAGWRKITFDLRARNTFDRLEEKLEAESIVTRLSLGHAWVFSKGLFISAEWASLAVPVLSRVSTAITTEGAVNDAIESMEADALEQVQAEAKRTTFGVTAQIGYQF